MTKPNYDKVILLAVVMVNALGVEYVEGKSLRHPKKGIVKTIKSYESSDVIDCVDIYKQPAFDHPLLKNHTMQMKPTAYPKGSKIKKFQEKVLVEIECPKGTIPIRRTQNHIGSRVSSLVSKTKLSYNHSYDIKEQDSRHEYTIVSLEGGTYFGAHAEINVWNPATNYGEMSISQIWVLTESGDNRNTIEAGWIVYPEVFGSETKFFIYWTADNYRNTGCYNLECPGFVQVNRKHLLGAPIRPISKYNSEQHHIEITIHQDQKTKNWWLRFYNEDLGYWPASIFTNIGGGAKIINWGGEITNYGLHHTTTQMGSGHFPYEGFGKASFFRELKYIDVLGNQIDADAITGYASKPPCYDVQIRQKGEDHGVNFYYGGPGRSAQCP